MKTLAFLFSTIILAGTVFASGQIDIAYSPYTISKPGSYIVVKDLTTAQNQNCITISTSNITIDLNGHTLYGAGTAGSSGSGIEDVSAGAMNLAIYNGTIRNFRTNGIELFGVNARVERVNVSGNNYFGIHLGASGLVSDCNVSNNSYVGIKLDGENCGGIIRNNQASNNQSDGIYGNNVAISSNFSYFNKGNGITALNCLVENNTLDSNNPNGISANSCRVIGNYCYGHLSGAGIVAIEYNTIENNTLFDNTTGISATGTANYIAGNRLTTNSVSISTTAGNTLGNGTTGFTNVTY